ncbi:hypothetical protein QEN42_19760 [Gordonia alkanivorans]|uniref:hypothetical protein n=1 Tax=Gordonia alkanivorans TaxID=84096 RepID=UPI002446C091|nr:hypothetical protein [Gordonia alkanivorans]MDH3052071.1 hypothetical protein [Gordonia alkanivorans]
MAQNPKKPAGKRRPTPKVAGHTRATQPGQTPDAPEVDASAPSLPEVQGAKAAGPGERGESTSHEGSGDDTSSSVDAADTDTPDTDTADTAPAKPDLTKPKTRPVSRVSTLRPSAAGRTDEDTSSNRPMGRPGRQGSAEGRKKRAAPLAAILAAAAVVLGIVAVVLAFHPGADVGPNKAFVDQEATSQLTGQAQERICAIFGYEHTELDAWQKRAQDALTGQAREEFDKTFKAQKDLITQTKTGAECRVDALGVKDLTGGGDGAHATVIANMIISETQNSMATNSGAPRAQFAMVKEGDTWRIQGVEPF